MEVEDRPSRTVFQMTSIQCSRPIKSDLVSHTNSRSVRIGDLGFSPMDRGQLDGSGSVKTVDLTFLHVGHGCVKVGKRATSRRGRPYCMRLRPRARPGAPAVS